MEYLEKLYWAILVVWLAEFYFFGMQRAILKISRNSGIDYRLLGAQLLPPWYSLMWFFRITKWLLLGLIFWLSSWKIGLTILIAMVVLSTIIPIPYKLLYCKLFYNRIEQLSTDDPETTSLLIELLNNADFASSSMNKAGDQSKIEKLKPPSEELQKWLETREIATKARDSFNVKETANQANIILTS